MVPGKSNLALGLLTRLQRRLSCFTWMAQLAHCAVWVQRLRSAGAVVLGKSSMARPEPKRHA